MDEIFALLATIPAFWQLDLVLELKLRLILTGTFVMDFAYSLRMQSFSSGM